LCVHPGDPECAKWVGLGASVGAGVGVLFASGCTAGTAGVCVAGAPAIVGAAAGVGGAIGGFLGNLVTALAHDRSRSLPWFGPRNGSLARDDGNGKGQIRDYGPDGRPKTDFDFGHDHTGAGDPHAHDFDHSKQPRDARSEPRPIRPNEQPPLR
jgi:hypothetical protein